MSRFRLSSLHLGYVTLGVYVLSLLLGRVCRIVYSAVATNIVYMNTLWPLVFQVVAFFMDLVCVSSAFGLIPQTMKRFGKTGAIVSFLLFIAAQILYGLSAFFIDLWSGAIEGIESTSIMNVGISMILPVGSAFVCLVMALIFGNKKPLLTSILSCLFYFLCHFGVVLYDIISFFQVYHYPTTDEVNSMITDVMTCIIHSGVIVLSLCFLWIFVSKRTRGGITVEKK